MGHPLTKLVVAAFVASTLLVSSPAAARDASLLIIGGYLVFMVIISRWLAWAGQGLTAELQLVLVGTAAIVLAAVVSSRVLRARLRVMLTKHLFQHRYDYREEWLRFTRTMGRGGAGEAPLQERAIRAVADMTDSPGGLLLAPTEQGKLGLVARWQWPTADVPAEALPARAVQAFEADRSGGFIIDLDELLLALFGRSRKEPYKTIQARRYVGKGLVIIKTETLKVLEQIEHYLTGFARIGQRRLKLHMCAFQLRVGQSLLIQAVVVEPFGQLAQNLRP